jgi:hypothetical protein
LSKLLNLVKASHEDATSQTQAYIDNMRGGWSHPLWQKKNKIKLATWKRKRKIKKERKFV